MAGAAASGPRRYIECQPRCEWIKIGEFDTLLVDFSGLGFKMEELKVQYSTSGNLTVSGETFVGGNRWLRFARSFQIPRDSGSVQGYRANFDKGVLYVLLPKLAGDGGKGALRGFVARRGRLILAVAVAIALIAGLGTAARKLS